MLRIRAFQGLRPALAQAPEVACVPYDVVNREEALVQAQYRPNSLMHVDRAEIDLPDVENPYDPRVYLKAAANLDQMQRNGALVRETARVIYLYRQELHGRSQIGIAAVCHIEDYEKEIIKKHEKTRKDKEDDRTRLIDTLSADTGPVFLTFRDHPAFDGLVEKAMKAGPLYDFIADDAVRHTVWRVENPAPYVAAFAQVPVAYVADGHHRTASAVRVGTMRRQANPAHTGNEDYNWFLAVLFPASQLAILPYNRTVKDLNGHTPEKFLAAVGAAFEVKPDGNPSPTAPGEISMYFQNAWYSLRWNPATATNPISSLDVSALQDRLLAPVLGIDDPRTSQRIEFVGGIRGTNELMKAVDSGKSAVAFSMYPTTVDQLMAIADASEIMPPKSTWFEPKLRSGLFIHTFER